MITPAHPRPAGWAKGVPRLPRLVSPLDPLPRRPLEKESLGETHPPTRGKECLASLGARVGPLGEARGPTGPGAALRGTPFAIFHPAGRSRPPPGMVILT